jgi:hypothetical protein
MSQNAYLGRAAGAMQRPTVLGTCQKAQEALRKRRRDSIQNKQSSISSPASNDAGFVSLSRHGWQHGAAIVSVMPGVNGC